MPNIARFLVPLIRLLLLLVVVLMAPATRGGAKDICSEAAKLELLLPRPLAEGVRVVHNRCDGWAVRGGAAASGLGASGEEATKRRDPEGSADY